MRFPLVLFACISFMPALALAQQPPQVAVVLGPAVQARVADLGRSDLDAVSDTLAREVGRAAQRSKAPISHIDLVIEDIQPNRPTVAQLGRSAGLSPHTYGLGGAAITGSMTVGGENKPIRFRFFQTDRRNAVNFSNWGDADQAFDMLSDRVARGEAPYDDKPWPAPRTAQSLTGTRIPG
ncbi:hypothetical protein [Caulobacter sp. S45]|uniref:hypothetical protein n=1 Tax=Caulobacter sp. S45 TaxID=1641861 RepID=UPI00131CCC5A|nr:hypothetical protein [Caulobacter sp. S45]